MIFYMLGKQYFLDVYRDRMCAYRLPGCKLYGRNVFCIILVNREPARLKKLLYCLLLGRDLARAYKFQTEEAYPTEWQ